MWEPSLVVRLSSGLHTGWLGRRDACPRRLIELFGFPIPPGSKSADPVEEIANTIAFIPTSPTFLSHTNVLADLPEQGPIITTPEIVLPYSPISLEEQPCSPQFHKGETPPGHIRGTAILLPHVPHLVSAQATTVGLVPAVKHGVEPVAMEMAVDVEDARIRPVLGLVDVGHVDT